MAEEIRELSNDDLEDVAGGKVTVRTPLPTRRLRGLLADAVNNGESLEWVLDQCNSDDERKWCSREWEKSNRH